MALPISQMRKLRQNGANDLPQAPTAEERRCWEASPAPQNPGSTTLSHPAESRAPQPLTPGDEAGMQTEALVPLELSCLTE